MDDDILNGLENQMAGDNGVAGGTPPLVQVLDASAAADGAGKSGYDLVADLLPVDQHKALGAWCVRYRIGEDDPFFGEKLAANVTFSSAAAAALAAVRVSEGVNEIPKTILMGAMQASKSVRGDINDVLKKGGEAILKSIDVAATAGSDKIKEGSKDLIEKLDAAVEVKKKEGVSEFALAAAEAATAAAGASAARVISETKVKLRYSLLTMSLIFLVYAGLGVFGEYEFLNLTHKIAPAPIVMLHGKPLCGVIALDGQNQDVCRIDSPVTD